MVKKITLWVLAIIVILFILITVLGYFEPQYREYKYNLAIRDAERIIKANEEALKNDKDGGKTPEETFDLFLTALKKGDIELASRYYELPSQPKVLESLKDELEKNGSLQKSIDYFTEVRTKGTKQCNERGDGCTFEYRGSDGYNRFFDVGLNDLGGVWKMEKPY